MLGRIINSVMRSEIHQQCIRDAGGSCVVQLFRRCPLFVPIQVHKTRIQRDFSVSALRLHRFSGKLTLAAASAFSSPL
jgi:hypothetical protein